MPVFDPAPLFLAMPAEHADVAGAEDGQAPPQAIRSASFRRRTTYMAVYRQIGGCEAPLTMVDYRNPKRR